MGRLCLSVRAEAFRNARNFSPPLFVTILSIVDSTDAHSALSETMSSSAFKDLPRLNGTNYRRWANDLEAYLRSQGLWSLTYRAIPDHERDAQGAITTDRTSQIEAWEDKNDQALGIIRLLLEPHIATRFSSQMNASSLWDELEDAFSTPTIASAFTEFKAMLDVTIPENNHPTPAFSKLSALFSRLEELEYPVPAKMQSMLILAKAPAMRRSLLSSSTRSQSLSPPPPLPLAPRRLPPPPPLQFPPFRSWNRPSL